MDWLLLILLVPAILVPIVLLFGFSGCSSFDSALADPVAPPLPPTLLHSELTKNRDGIILTWMNNDGNTVTSYIERINESVPGLFPTPLTTSTPAAIFGDTVGNGLSEGEAWAARCIAVMHQAFTVLALPVFRENGNFVSFVASDDMKRNQLSSGLRGRAAV